MLQYPCSLPGIPNNGFRTLTAGICRMDPEFDEFLGHDEDLVLQAEAYPEIVIRQLGVTRIVKSYIIVAGSPDEHAGMTDAIAAIEKIV